MSNAVESNKGVPLAPERATDVQVEGNIPPALVELASILIDVIRNNTASRKQSKDDTAT